MAIDEGTLDSTIIELQLKITSMEGEVQRAEMRYMVL